MTTEKSSLLFIKVDHNFPEHRKTEELSDRAFRQLITAWCYCARNANDGKLTDAQARKLFTPKTIGELAKVGYLHAVDSGYEMHEYTKHQMSAADIADLRSKRAEAGSKGGKAKASATASAKQLVKQTASKVVAELEVEVEGSLSSKRESPVSNASADEAPTLREESRSAPVDLSVMKIVRSYTSKVNPSNASNIAAHITNALATWDLDTIAKAVAKMAAEGRQLGADSLRIELNQIGPDKHGMQRFQDGTSVDWNTGKRTTKGGVVIGGGGYWSGKQQWSEG